MFFTGIVRFKNYAAMDKEPPFQVRGLFFILNIHKHHTCHNIQH
jgi:hypothetical protein